MKGVTYRKPPTYSVGRNKPCPCNSGKKFKQCCLPRVRILENVPIELRPQVIAESILGKPL